MRRLCSRGWWYPRNLFPGASVQRLVFKISLGARIANCRETRPLDPAQQDPVAWPAGACIFLLCALVRPGGGGWIGWWRPRRKAVCLSCKRRRTADDMVRSRRPCPRCFGNNVSSRERGFPCLLYHAQSRSLGTGAFVVDKSSSIVVRLDMRARPVACVSGAIDETLASCLLARAARPTVPSLFLSRPAPLAPSPMGQRPTTGSRLLPPFPDGFQRELGAAHGPGQLHNLWAAHSAQKFSSVGPAKYGFAAHVSRVQEPRSGVFRSLARQFGTASGLGGLALWHWGRPSFLRGVPLTEWAGPTGPGGREGSRGRQKEPASSASAAPTRPGRVTERGRGAGARFQHACRS